MSSFERIWTKKSPSLVGPLSQAWMRKCHGHNLERRASHPSTNQSNIRVFCLLFLKKKKLCVVLLLMCFNKKRQNLLLILRKKIIIKRVALKKIEKKREEDTGFKNIGDSIFG